MSAYTKGKKAFYNYKYYKKGNPYKVGTDEHQSWEYGFNLSYFSNLNWTRGKERKDSTSSS